MWTYPARSIRGTWNRPECHLQALVTIPRLCFSLPSDSRRTLIWRAPGTRYHQEITIELIVKVVQDDSFREELFFVPELICMFSM
ncbi:hypothetical protein TNCV_3959891 [Trichonephila clavipes]|nr:hypothetical protein TNCV_3959891 [Trichonephila clavipes]